MSIDHGPNGTPVTPTASASLTMPFLNWDADFRRIPAKLGEVKYTDLTAPQERPSIIRIAQTVRSNIYSGSTIDPSAFLGNRRGTDTLIELRETWGHTPEGSTSEKQADVRFALQFTVPTGMPVTADDIEQGVMRLLATLGSSDAAFGTGVTALLRGSLERA